MMKGGLLLKLAVIVVLVLAIPKQALTEWVYVQRVIDGYTIVIAGGVVVRIKHIDTPEVKHTTKGEEPGGKPATELAKFFLEHNYVWLEGDEKDKYGRREAEVKLPGGVSY
ncbi:MAG: thermonuclease family protein [Thermodesulfobacteriota bacterium]